MFPIRDHNPSGRTPYVTWAIMAVNIAVFLLYAPLLGDPARLASFFDVWALEPAELMAGRDQHTLLTSMFLHGGLLHIAGNMLFLWIFGDNVEDALGHAQYLVFYLLSGVAASAAQIAANPDSTIPMVGASGAIAGVMGAYLLLYPRARVDVVLILGFFIQLISLSAWIVLAAWMALQLVGGFATPTDMGGVAYWAHAGGFVAGVVLVLPLWLGRGATDWWRRTDYHPPHPPTFEEERTHVPTVRRKKR